MGGGLFGYVLRQLSEKYSIQLPSTSSSETWEVGKVGKYCKSRRGEGNSTYMYPVSGW